MEKGLELALETLKSTILSKLQDTPILIFQSDDMPATRDSIATALLGTGHDMHELNNEMDAAIQQGTSESIWQGVFLLNRSLARGYDLKFAQDAYVIVFSHDGMFPWTE